MKQATIPYLSWEGNPPLSTLASALEARGRLLTIDTLNWEKDFPYAPRCSVRIAYSDQGLLLHYSVQGFDIRTLSPGDGNYVHEDSCVEFFMQREQGQAYINFEFNAAGVCYAAHHASPSEAILLSPQEFASIQRLATFSGQKREESGAIVSWELSTLIPWETMGYIAIPEYLWANFYKCGDKTAHPHFLSWAPIDEPAPAFHRPQFFGKLILAPRD